MKCLYCNQSCWTKHQDNPFWLCKTCHVFFKKDGSEIVFRPNTDQYWYWLHVNTKENKTKVFCQRNPKSIDSPEELASLLYDNPKLIVSCQPAIQGVTPQNMHDRLKTILLFS
mgnify:CR=1 FL=1